MTSEMNHFYKKTIKELSSLQWTFVACDIIENDIRNESFLLENCWRIKFTSVKFVACDSIENDIRNEWFLGENY